MTVPRPKTDVARRCPLWPETAAAIREAVAARPEPKTATAAAALFVTKDGHPWSSDVAATAVTHELGKLLTRLGLSGRRAGFYTLRHTFRTAADATRDPNAIRRVMGHTDDRIADHYTHGIDDGRLRALADHVRGWLFAPDGRARTDPSA